MIFAKKYTAHWVYLPSVRKVQLFTSYCSLLSLVQRRDLGRSTTAWYIIVLENDKRLRPFLASG